jgi:hypothetical protein
MNREHKFWNWFLSHEPELFQFDPCEEEKREQLFDEIGAQLQKVDRGLTFEFGPPAAKREFVISAAGIKGVFPAVIRLSQAAPTLEHWHITAFRPRRSPVMPIEIGDQCVDPSDVQFTLLNNGKMAGLYLFIPGFREDDITLTQIGYLMLDQTLGEFDIESRLGLIKMLAPEAQTKGDRHPLADLPIVFDQLVAKLEGRSGATS